MSFSVQLFRVTAKLQELSQQRFGDALPTQLNYCLRQPELTEQLECGMLLPWCFALSNLHLTQPHSIGHQMANLSLLETGMDQLRFWMQRLYKCLEPRTPQMLARKPLGLRTSNSHLTVQWLRSGHTAAYLNWNLSKFNKVENFKKLRRLTPASAVHSPTWIGP